MAKSTADSLLWQLPWGHHALLLEKVKPVEERRWYIAQTLAQGWSRATLMLMIDSQAHQRQGVGASNFGVRLLAPQSELVAQALKDPYVFDFLTLEGAVPRARAGNRPGAAPGEVPARTRPGLRLHGTAVPGGNDVRDHAETASTIIT